MIKTKTITAHERWEDPLRGYWPTIPDDACREITQALVDAEASGNTSCVWHECHLWNVKHILPTWPRCTICGGRLAPRRDGIELHELCRLRKLRGSPIRQRNATMRCGCVNCEKAGKR